MNCSVCGNKVDDITKGCPTCGNYANSGIEYCYNCGKQNTEQYLICSGCKTPLVAKQSFIISVFLSFFVLFPFLALYVGRKKEALIRIVIFLVGVLAFTVSASFAKNEAIMASIQGITLITWGFLFVWSAVDIIRLLFYWPKPYTNGKGQRLAG
ncbi:MAG TPA: hypothetical protein VNX68_00100 [Nitrosopumilaceae archaeon]|jgi:hypothetical protein|nr:hypothetical protein [Nitrosopumilaceae archaeon]